MTFFTHLHFSHNVVLLISVFLLRDLICVRAITHDLLLYGTVRQKSCVYLYVNASWSNFGYGRSQAVIYCSPIFSRLGVYIGGLY